MASEAVSRGDNAGGGEVIDPAVSVPRRGCEMASEAVSRKNHKNISLPSGENLGTISM